MATAGIGGLREYLTSTIERPYSHHHLDISTSSWRHFALYPIHLGFVVHFVQVLRLESQGGTQVANAATSAAFGVSQAEYSESPLTSCKYVILCQL
jgi:hypothetical protein